MGFHSPLSRTIAGLGGFVLALFVTELALRQLVPAPAEYGLEAKLSYLAEAGGDFDTIFIGSSRVAYGVDAVAFDEHMAELGAPTRSFNMGVGGMTTVEANQVLSRVLALELPALRTVVLEFGAWDGRIYDRKNALSNRSIGWHTPGNTWQALVALGNTPLPRRQEHPLTWRLGDFVTHFDALARNLFCVGAGPRTVAGLVASEPAWRRDKWLTVADLEERRGFQDLSAIDDEFRVRGHEEFLKRPGKFTRRVAHIPAQIRAQVPLADHHNLQALAAQIGRIEAAGLRPIYFTPPGKLGQPLGRCLHAAGRLPAYLAFDDPERYPELYALESRNDAVHLNGLGAALLAEHLAREFMALNPVSSEGDAALDNAPAAASQGVDSKANDAGGGN
ncbi:MAG: hypothetical protein QF724_05670 [Planctomycetota bacterium]|jgi:hypothetical protein|nr:hypothetical protein [Planctomycetota bacterium]